jgi:hypothetical protein
MEAHNDIVSYDGVIASRLFALCASSGDLVNSQSDPWQECRVSLYFTGNLDRKPIPDANVLPRLRLPVNIGRERFAYLIGLCVIKWKSRNKV